MTVNWDGTEFEAAVFADLLEPVGDGRLEGTYTADYYAGSGALVSCRVGKGTAYYYGSAWTEEAARIFLAKLQAVSPYSGIIELPETCEIAVRKKDGQSYLFVLNYKKDPAELMLRTEGTDLYTGNRVSGKLTLEGYGTMVIKL